MHPGDPGGTEADRAPRSRGAATGSKVEQQIIAFLTGIGLTIRRDTIVGDAVLPGLTIHQGALVVCPEGPRFVGDLLHEAGHLALLSPSERARVTGRLDDTWGTAMEPGAICWSVAAAWHLGLDSRVVLHDHGYRDAGARLATTFEAGVYPGLPVLVDAGLAHMPRNAPEGEPGFPAMRQWLRS